MMALPRTTSDAAASPELERLWAETRRLSALPLDSRVDENGVIDSICGAARNVAAADGACVVLREGALVHYAREDAIAPLWAGRRFPVENCISGWSITHRERVVIDDIYDDPRIPAEYYRPTFVKSLAMQPIDSGQPIGAIGVYWARRHTAAAPQLDALERVADLASLVITNLRLRAALAAASAVEPVTSAAPVRDVQAALTAASDRSGLVWKFVPVPKADQQIYWVWQAWTHSGQLHARSHKAFDLFSECEDDAQANGYVQPDRRL